MIVKSLFLASCPSHFKESFKATPHKARLKALYRIRLHIFRHLAQKFLDIRQYACGISIQSDEKSVGASPAQALFGIALNHGGFIMFEKKDRVKIMRDWINSDIFQYILKIINEEDGLKKDECDKLNAAVAALNADDADKHMGAMADLSSLMK